MCRKPKCGRQTDRHGDSSIPPRAPTNFAAGGINMMVSSKSQATGKYATRLGLYYKEPEIIFEQFLQLLQ